MAQARIIRDSKKVDIAFIIQSEFDEAPKIRKIQRLTSAIIQELQVILPAFGSVRFSEALFDKGG